VVEKICTTAIAVFLRRMKVLTLKSENNDYAAFETAYLLLGAENGLAVARLSFGNSMNESDIWC
jgi:hypothetical protein